MSILIRSQIEELIEQGVITNVTPDLLNPASVDITLGNQILVEKDTINDIEINKNGLPMFRLKLGEDVDADVDYYVLGPGEFILGCSQQLFNIPANISAEFKMKSTAGRCGLSHMMAGWCDPGWHGSALTMELKNMTLRNRLILRPGMRIGQMIFFKHDSVPDEHLYKGRYNNDLSVEGAKVLK